MPLAITCFMIEPEEKAQLIKIAESESRTYSNLLRLLVKQKLAEAKKQKKI